MKTLFKMATTTALLIGMAVSSSAFAQEWRYTPRTRQFDMPRVSKDISTKWVLAFEMQKAKISILAELSRQTESTIELAIQNKPIWTVVTKYKIDPKIYQIRFVGEASNIISHAAIDGKISKAQADNLIERINRMPSLYGAGASRGLVRGFGRRYGWCCPWF